MAEPAATSDAEELVATLAEAEQLVTLLEEATGLVVSVADVQGVRGPKGPPGATGPQGERGERGPAGASAGSTVLLSKWSRGPLSAGRVVRLDGAAHCAPISALNVEDALTPISVVQYAVSEPDAEVQLIPYGEFEDDTYTFSPGGAVFVGPGGQLTQVPSKDWAFVRVVGFALSATRVFVDPQMPVLQAQGGDGDGEVSQAQ